MKLKNSYIYMYYSMLAIVLLYLIFTKSILGDENSPVDIALSYGFESIISEKYINNFNPFGYFLFAKISYFVFEYSAIFKIIPAIFFIISVVFYYKIISLVINNKIISHFGTILFSILPLNLYFSQFNKPYSFLLLFSLLIFYLSMLIKNAPSKKLYFLYISTVTVGLYTHFFVGLFTAIIFLIGLFFKELREKRFIVTIFVLNVVSLVIFIPELISFLEKTKDIVSIEQSHASLGYFKKLAFVIYGSFFGDTLAPINIFIISMVAFSFIGIFYGIIKNSNIIKDKTLLFSFGIFMISVLLISATGFARPMYVVFTTPFIAFILIKLFYEYKIKFPVAILFGLFLFSNFNFITSNSKYFTSPQYSLDYQYYYGEFLNENIDNNTLIVVSPSYNKSSFALYKNKSLPSDVVFINPFENIENQLVFDTKKYTKVLVFQEFHNQDIFENIDKYLREFQSNNLVDLKHTGFINKQEYSYFKVMEYIR